LLVLLVVLYLDSIQGRRKVAYGQTKQRELKKPGFKYLCIYTHTHIYIILLGDAKSTSYISDTILQLHHLFIIMQKALLNM